MRISVITPVRNGGEWFRACMTSLAACDPPAHEIIVVIDGEDDGSGEFAEALGARVLRLPASIGPPGARNLGAAEATGEILLSIDADIIVPRDLVGRVAAYLRDNPGIAAVIGSYDDAPADPGFLSQYRNLLHHYVHQTGHEEASTFWSGCGAIRRDVFTALRGLDSSYSGPYIVEDIEFGYRLRQAGHRIRLCKDLQVTHLKRWTAPLLLRTDVFLRAIPWTRLAIRSGVLPNDLNVGTRSRISVALVAVLGAALVALPSTGWALGVAAVAAAGLTVLNAGFYRFLWRVRGPAFMIAAVPWHWVYYACAGIGFLIGGAQELVGRRTPAPAAIAATPKDR